VTVEHLTSSDGDLRIICAAGELDVLTVAPLLEQVPDLVQGATAVVLDLSAVTFFDSSGVRLVDHLSRGCAAAGAGFRVVAPPSSRSRRVLELVGMADGLAEDDLDAACGALRRL
jgi:anti-sigma B factor antagonist